MFAAIPYTIYQWKPPELSRPEKIWLGGEIAKVGRKAFVRSLKQRLSKPARGSNNKPFTLAEVLGDAEKLSNGSRQSRPSMIAVLAASLFVGACFCVIAAFHFVVPFLVVGSASGGSLLWMYNKVDRWAQSLIDEYTHAVANGKLPKEEALSTGSETTAALLGAEAVLEPVSARLPEHGPQFSAVVQPQTPEVFLKQKSEPTDPVIVARPAEEARADTAGALDQGPAPRKRWEPSSALMTASVLALVLVCSVCVWLGNTPRTLVPVSAPGTAGPVENAAAAYRRGDYATALQLFRPLADQGNVSAQYYLGVMYSNGRGVPKNDAEAVKWYRLAADQGFAVAQNNLGYAMLHGLGGAIDKVSAVRYFTAAAAKGQVNAITSLADCYEKGNGVPVDLERAVSLYTEAAKRGFHIAHLSLGLLYERGLGLPHNDVYATAHYLLATRKIVDKENSHYRQEYDKALSALGRMTAALSTEQWKRAQGLADSWPAVRPATTEVAMGSE